MSSANFKGEKEKGLSEPLLCGKLYKIIMQFS